ncbi:MAG: mycoredoxin [Candidatus Nanopelagicaceae bacterium]|nr:mycoredoxin [Candidatus Nanopelagicaceae bacterium]
MLTSVNSRRGMSISGGQPDNSVKGDDFAMSDLVTMYTTSWCGYCTRLKRQLDEAGVLYSEINIENTPGAAAIVEKANNGNQTVPTLVFSDGFTVTNPRADVVIEKLQELSGRTN